MSKKYILLTEGNENELEDSVNEMMTKGYVPLAGASVAYGFSPTNVPECQDVYVFSQAMVLHEQLSATAKKIKQELLDEETKE